MSATETLLQNPGLLQLADEFDANKVTPGVLGFLVFAAMGLVIWFLMKSLNRRLGRVDFDESVASSRPSPGAGPAGTGGPDGPEDGPAPGGTGRDTAGAAPGGGSPKA